VADPRYYEIELPAVSPAAALSVTRQLLAACAEPPIERCAYGRLSLASVPAVAALVPLATLESALTFHPAEWMEVARRLRSPRVGSWLATQKHSRFGSCLHLGGRSGEGEVQLDFEGEPGREREERPRLERFLEAVVGAGLLPPGAPVTHLVDRFLAEAVLPPGQPPPRSGLVIVQDGMVARVPGWRATRDRVYGPIGLSLEVPPSPVDPILSLAVGGGLLELVVISGMDSELATQVAGIGDVAFTFWCDEAQVVDERTVDGLVDAVGAEPLRIDWDCAWPGGGEYLNGVVLLVNAVGDPSVDLVPAPGEVAVYLSLHPRVDDRRPDAFAHRLAQRAGLRLAHR